ncbi:MAG: hypothetical protein KTR23_10725 [Rhodospirillales bacterium]|nr:hypothetical protein [Rhodospirillales bacterium]
MNIAPKPKMSPGLEPAVFPSAFATTAEVGTEAADGAEAGLAAGAGSADLTTLGAAVFVAGFTAGFAATLAAGLAAAFTGFGDGVADTSAAFLAAVVVFGVVGAAVLGVAAVLLFVLTVLAFSVSGEDSGDFAAAVAFTTAEWAIADFASGCCFATVAAAEAVDFFEAVLADAAFFWVRAGEAPPFAIARCPAFASAIGAFFALGASGFSTDCKDAVFADAELDAEEVNAGSLVTLVAVGSPISGFATSALAETGSTSAALAFTLPCALGSNFLTSSRTPEFMCLAAASISEDVITTRFGEATVFDCGTGDTGDADLAADFVGSAAETAELTVVLADPDAFFPNFPEAFCFETAIASTSCCSGYRPEIMLHRNITLDGITRKGQEHFSDNPPRSPQETLCF